MYTEENKVGSSCKFCLYKTIRKTCRFQSKKYVSDAIYTSFERARSEVFRNIKYMFLRQIEWKIPAKQYFEIATIRYIGLLPPANLRAEQLSNSVHSIGPIYQQRYLIFRDIQATIGFTGKRNISLNYYLL